MKQSQNDCPSVKYAKSHVLVIKNNKERRHQQWNIYDEAVLQK